MLTEKFKLTLSLILILMLGTIYLPAIGLAQGDSWDYAGVMPILRGCHASCLVDSIIYVIGGVTSDSYPNATPLVQAYNPATGTWTEKAAMITARLLAEACVINRKIYTIGGSLRVDGVVSSAVEMYDPVTNEWTTCTSLPSPRTYFGSAVVNGKIYAVGGMYDMQARQNLYVYNPDTDIWITKRPMPTPRNYISACCCGSGKIFVFGGAPGWSNTALKLVEMYDPLNDTWETKHDMPSGIQHPRSCSINNKIYMMGGRTVLHGAGTNKNYQYDPVQDSWNADLEKMWVARVYHTITAFNDKIYVIGGTRDGGLTGLEPIIDVYTPPIPTDVKEKKGLNRPYNWNLLQNYPNPFNPITTIEYSLTKDSNVRILVYNSLGQVVAVLVDGYQAKGSYCVKWDAKNQPSGIYIYRLEADGFSAAKKMFLQK